MTYRMTYTDEKKRPKTIGVLFFEDVVRYAHHFGVHRAERVTSSFGKEKIEDVTGELRAFLIHSIPF